MPAPPPRVSSPAPPDRVWAALTTAEGLSAWFGDEATIDLRPGGAATMTWDAEGFTARMRVERALDKLRGLL